MHNERYLIKKKYADRYWFYFFLILYTNCSFLYIIGLEDSSESETDNNDETGTTDKFLLLIDQLSSEQPHHLSIKDIGIILDRLRLVLRAYCLLQ